MTGRAVRKAFDRAPERGIARLSVPAVVDVRPVKRRLTVQQAVAWAFGTECCSLDFDELAPVAGVDTLWVLGQRAALGCKVDGGGASARASDAEIIAAVLATLPEARGGRAMALCVARHGQRASMPDWDVPLRRWVEPVAWAKRNQHKASARTAVVPPYGPQAFALATPVLCCPVVCVSTAQAQASARREWLRWRAALQWLGWSLASVRFERVVLVDGLPPLRPWAAQCGAGGQDMGLTRASSS